MPNTAGKEQSISATVGFRERNVTTYFNVSNNYQKNGLFELEHDHDEHDHEHGEGEHDHDDDHDATEDTSHRNIGLPYATSNHFMITNNTEWQKGNNTKLVVNTAYQSNHRKEFEHFHEHYEGQQRPSQMMILLWISNYIHILSMRGFIWEYRKNGATASV